MNLTSLSLLFLAILVGQSYAAGWQRIPNSNPLACWLNIFRWSPEAGCPGGPAIPQPQPPPAPQPNPKQQAQAFCNGKNAGSIALFKADGTHYGCFNPTCSESSGWIPGHCK